MLRIWTRGITALGYAALLWPSAALAGAQAGSPEITSAAEALGAELALCWEDAGHEGTFSAQVQFRASREGRTSDVALGGVTPNLAGVAECLQARILARPFHGARAADNQVDLALQGDLRRAAPIRPPVVIAPPPVVYRAPAPAQRQVLVPSFRITKKKGTRGMPQLDAMLTTGTGGLMQCAQEFGNGRSMPYSNIAVSMDATGTVRRVRVRGGVSRAYRYCVQAALVGLEAGGRGKTKFKARLTWGMGVILGAQAPGARPQPPRAPQYAPAPQRALPPLQPVQPTQPVPPLQQQSPVRSLPDGARPQSASAQGGAVTVTAPSAIGPQVEFIPAPDQ